MITYEITAIVPPQLVDTYERFMRDQHIPDVLATNAFQTAVFAQSAPGRYQIRYEAATAEILNQYLAQHAPRLRAHFIEQFGDTVELSREVWATMQQWPAADLV